VKRIWRVKFCDSSAGKRTLYRRTSSAPARARRLASLTLKGSARGIGAWKVTATAEEYALAAQESGFEKLARNFEQLGRAILEARAAIRVLLAAP